MTFIYLNIVRLSWFLGATTLFMYDKIEIQKYFNRIGNPFIDSMSKALTHAGDGIFAIVVCITFLFIRLKTALLLFISFTVSAGIVQLLKHFVFSDMKRPYFSLRYDPDFRIIEKFNLSHIARFSFGTFRKHFRDLYRYCISIPKENNLANSFGLICNVYWTDPGLLVSAFPAGCYCGFINRDFNSLLLLYFI